MFEGLRWRWSRDLEVSVTMAAVIGNRIPMSGEAVNTELIRACFPFYKALPAADEDEE
jgi:hypothetical protein